MGDDRSIEVLEHRDEAGRRYTFAPVHRDGASGIGIHFSAFFGRWGNAKVYRDTFGGYFHRRRMLGDDPSLDWLFCCDAYGAFGNGCYYQGEAGDLYVERATRAIIDRQLAAWGHRPDRAILIGSSMGATAALAFGLDLGAAGVVAVCPHVDLDVSAARQDRMAEVGWICPDGDPLAAHNRHLTRPIERRLDAWPADRPLPRLFVQSCEDDAGVHEEQVLPLVDRWRSLGGRADLDARPVGGHTSDWATKALLLDATHRILDGSPIDVERYSSDPEFVGQLVVPTQVQRARRRLGLLRRRISP